MSIFSLSGIVIATTALILTGILLIYGKSKLHKIWTLFNLAVFVWGIGCFLAGRASSPPSALFGWRIAISGGLFIGVFFYHTMYTFAEIQKKKILLTIYIQALFFLLLTLTTEATLTNWQLLFNSIYYPMATFSYTLMVISWVIVVYLGHKELILFLKKSKGIKHTQAKYLLIAFLVGFIGGSLTLVPAFNINIYPLGNFTIPLYCLIVTYAIFRYRFMDIKLIFKKTMAYSLSAGLLTAFFAFLVITVTNLFSSYAHVSSFTISIFAVIIIALLFNPLRNRIQKLIDKVFYKKTYDYIETVNKVSHELASMLDIKKIFNFVGDIIFSTMGLRSIYLLSAGPGGDYEVVYNMSYGGTTDDRPQTTDKRLQTSDPRQQDTDHRPQSTDNPPITKGGQEEGSKGGGQGWRGGLKIDGNSDMIRLLKTSDDVVIKDELPGIVEILGQETIENISNTVKPFNGEVVVPVFIDDKLSLLIVLSGKLSGDIFTDEDVNLLKTFSNQTAIAIKNASLYAEKFRSEKFASIGMMSATFAHEIRNPLTSIKTFAQLFPDKYTDTEFREIFSKIVIDDVERIDGLIKDLLNFSGEKTFPRMNEIEIVSLIDEILNYLKNKLDLENKKISVEKIYKDVKINILGDSEKLKQAFVNIITNGCQAMGENGVLKVNITPNGREVDIAISDTGKGILQEEISRLFDPFYTTKPMGMGLGLAISKKIIEDHGGRIIVESEISKGTTFTVTLPVSEEVGSRK